MTKQEQIEKLRQELNDKEEQFNKEKKQSLAEIHKLQDEIDTEQSEKYQGYVGKFLRVIRMEKDKFVETQSKEVGNYYIKCSSVEIKSEQFIVLKGYTFFVKNDYRHSFFCGDYEFFCEIEDVRVHKISKEVFVDAYNEYVEKELEKINDLQEYTK